MLLLEDKAILANTYRLDIYLVWHTFRAYTCAAMMLAHRCFSNSMSFLATYWCMVNTLHLHNNETSPLQALACAHILT